MRKYWYFMGKDGETIDRIFKGVKLPEIVKKEEKHTIIDSVLLLPEKTPETALQVKRPREKSGSMPEPGKKKKGVYYIVIAKKNKGVNFSTMEKEGYIFNIDGLFSGPCKNNKIWDITDLKTGCICSEPVTRLQDIEKAIHKNMEIIKNVYESPRYKTFIELIEKAYKDKIKAA